MEGQDLELFERSLRHATEQSTGESLDAALAELGWSEALSLDPQAAISTLFALQGFANSTSAALDAVVNNGLGLVGTDTSLVYPRLGRTDPPGQLTSRGVTVDGLGTARFASRERSHLIATDGDIQMTVAVDTANLTLREIRGLDPALGLVAVSGEAVVVASSQAAPSNWIDALAAGQLAVAYELLGASRKMLDLARDHALERVQFGQPIGLFQAVRHRLADTLIVIEAADAAVTAAWDPRSAQAAALGKALAGRAALTAARHCQQVLAGMGFTAEHPFHRYVRRVLVLDHLLGSARLLTTQFGAELLRTRQLPQLLPL